MTTKKLGLPCWKEDNIANVITTVAKLDQTQIHYFLASHAPIKYIYDDRRKINLDEFGFFHEIFDSKYKEVLSLVYGDPGTGKSHLIHWLKLRCDYEIGKGKLKDIVPILVQRRTGSLKDALDQMVQQLPPEFERYLSPIREAIGQISHGTAKETLVGQLRLELGPKWKERGRDPLTRVFKNINEICASAGFRKWLCRDGGVIDANVKRLTGESNVEERETLPRFTEREFLISDEHKRDNTEDVIQLIDEFDDDIERRNEAADYFNIVLPSALKEMSGLSGNRLRDIFDNVRKDLKKNGKALALFIEDVSVMSELDVEIINAVEPQSRADLCRMIAVIGATKSGTMKLVENQRQRITHMISLGESARGDWCMDKEEVSLFTLRYLNAVRMKEKEVKELAVVRQDGSDVNISSCTDCPVKETCHETFGYMELNQVRIGFYPFSIVAPHRILERLDTSEGGGMRKNQRGLLDYVIRPVLSDCDSLEKGAFPQKRLAVTMDEIPFWTSFTEKYCGGWGPRDINRLKFLAQGWVDARLPEDMAEKLTPFLSILNFPKFSATSSKRPDRPEPDPPPGKKTPKEDRKKEEPVETSSELKEILANLRIWREGEPLKNDTEIRKMIADFIRKSVPWDDECFPPLEVWKNLVGGTRYDFVYIEGQMSITRQKFSIELPKNEETHKLIEALAQYRYAGSRSWNFIGAESHERNMSRWLRKYKSLIIAKLQPKADLDTSSPVAFAIQLLTFMTILRRRSGLPENPASVIAEILSGDLGTDVPMSLTKSLGKIIESIYDNHEQIRNFLIQELNVPQGRMGKVNFIDPMPILRIVQKFLEDEKIHSLPEEYFENYWQTRYISLNKFKNFIDIKGLVKEEKDNIFKLLSEIKIYLSTAGMKIENPSQAIKMFCSELVELVKVMEEEKFYLPDSEFDSIKKEFTEKAGIWSDAIKKVGSLEESNKIKNVMCFDPCELARLKTITSTANRYLDRLNKEVQKQESHLTQGENIEELSKKLMKDLKNISSTGEKAIIELEKET